MRKRNRWTSGLLALAMSALPLGCKGAEPAITPPSFPTYDVSQMAAEKTFSFASELDERPAAIYPESTGRTIYVSADGADGSSGLNKSAPTSIRAVNAMALRPGDKVLLKGGDNFLNKSLLIDDSGDDDNPIYIGAYDTHNGRPNVIYGGYGGAVVCKRVSNVVVEGLEITINTTAAVGTVTTHGILFDYGNYTAGSGDTYKNIYVLDNLVHGGSKIDVDSWGIRIFGTADYAATSPHGYVTNIHVKNNTVHSMGIDGITSSFENWGEGTTDHNGATPDVYRNIYFENNTVYNIGYIGIIMQCSSNGAISRNVVYKTAQTTSGVDYSGDAGIMPIACENIDVTFNETYENHKAHYIPDAMGIDIDWNCRDIRVKYNYCHDNMGSGIGTMANKDCTIANNKIVNSRGLVQPNYHYLSVGDFTNYANEHPDELRSVKNLTVENNLLLAEKPFDAEAQSDLTFFGAFASNGRGEWEGNVYRNNHVVSRIADKNVKIVWNDISPSRAWYQFAGNRYYGIGDHSVFTAYDETPQDSINPEAIALSGGIAQTFDVWKTRDTGASYSVVDNTVPDDVRNVTAVYADGKITFGWDSDDAVWHYNLYLVADGEKQAYVNMLGEAFGNTFTQNVPYKGAYYFVIEPESNTGVLGKPTKVKIELQ